MKKLIVRFGNKKNWFSIRLKNIITYLINKKTWYTIRSLEPKSRYWGFDRGDPFGNGRGTPVDRIYIEDFLKKNQQYITGSLCEIADSSYITKFGNNINNIEVLHYVGNKHATIVGDLTDLSTLPEDHIDCFIVTQTLMFIYDYKSAIRGIYYMLKTNGTALVTVAGISQISREDMNLWGDYWKFTDLSIKKSFDEIFGEGNVEVITYGNVLTATAFLQGISAEELTKGELFYKDEDYQVTIAIKATKK